MLSSDLFRFCDTFGLNRQRVQQLIRNGFIRLEAGRPGPGRAARITTREAFRLALMVRLLDVGVPRKVAAAATRDPLLFDASPDDTRDTAAFLVVSTGRLAPRLAEFYGPREAARVQTDPEANVSAVDVYDDDADEGAADYKGRDPALFSWITIPGFELNVRLADARRDASVVIALDPLHERVLSFFEDEQGA